MAAELELVAAAVTGALTGGLAKPLLVPVDALAEHWKEKIKARLARISEAAAKKHDGRLIEVNERVAYQVLTTGAFTDDDVTHEYLAGVIAASSSGTDDGAPVLAQINRLSSFQLRMHYVLYRELWRAATTPGRVALMGYNAWPWRWHIYLPTDALVAALGAESFSRDRFDSSASWLVREDLIGSFRSVRPDKKLKFSGSPFMSEEYAVPAPGFVLETSGYGVTFFLWGCGASEHHNLSLNGLTREAIDLDPPIAPVDGLLLPELQSFE